ncbi:hypothetical protein HID58_041345 [Brassica napus]|uniref:Uncharacterized protein n=1 Tax=Brassica napus TaxID=3708 RepID=A0ABQ8BAJ7_BRANA|nr:hypothetical protein HID58_041345 [Brassica napus]
MIRVWMILILQQTWRYLRLMLLEEARERFRMKETRQERRSCCVSEQQKKKQSIDRETKSFIEGLVHSSVNSLGDILRAQMASMESMFKERMGNMESRVSQLREAISLCVEEAFLRAKPMKLRLRPKPFKLQQRKRSIKLKLQLRKRYFLKESVELDVLVSRMLS